MPVIERLDELEINQMVRNNTDNHETAFTVSVDHCSTGTGISAYERAKTVKALLIQRPSLPISDDRGTYFPALQRGWGTAPCRPHRGGC